MKQKLELTWIGKNNPPNVEPRILLHKNSFDYGDPDSANMLIHADNMLALQALQQDFAGQVKCIYIDPPYNTGAIFPNYNDNLQHSTWLSIMSAKLFLLKTLLKDDGSIWISIDDDEQAYLKVLCDEIFGRNNFVCNVVWEKKYSPQNDAKYLSDSHDFILVYAKDKSIWRPNLLPRTEEMNSRYKNPDNDPRGVWTSSDFSAKTYNANTDYEIISPSGKIFRPAESRSWISSKKEFERLVSENRIWFGKNGNNMPRVKKFLSEVQGGSVSKTIWKREEVGDNQDAKKEVKVFNSEEVFATPKPERLIERILTLATAEGDLVLDCFLGSGTTAAVAQKMKRRWIGIEKSESCFTHCAERLRKVTDGEQGGISKSVNWQGGGGFKFYEVAPTLIIKDAHGHKIINPKYTAEMLAAAVAKHNGYKYAPDEKIFWKQGQNYENSYIYTMRGHLTAELLEEIAAAMSKSERLLICVTAFDAGVSEPYNNITLKKIPQTLLGNCEYGVDDYDVKMEAAYE